MRSRRILPVLGLGCGVLFGPSAGPAQAHTELVSSRPAPQSVLAAPPSSVVLQFSNEVETGAESVRVLDHAKRPVEVGPAVATGGGRSVSAPLSAGAGRGVFTVSWRVVAADGHPLQGAFTYRVGAGDEARSTAATAGSRDQQSSNGAVGVLLGASRWVAYAGLIVLVGGAAFLHSTWPAGWTNRRARRLIWAGWGAAAVGTTAALVLQGPSSAGRSLADAVDGELLREVMGTRVGEAWLARLALLGLAAVLLLRRRPSSSSRSVASLLVWAVVGVAMLVTAALAGHASTSGLAAAAVATDSLHLAALSIWLGGLAVLAVAMLPSPPLDRAAVARFSRTAFACVVVTALTGAVQSWREVGSADALANTRYGGLLIAKVAVFALLVGAAAVSRRWVRGRVRNASVAVLRRSLGAEVGLAVVVLALASVLVATPPARSSFAAPYRAELRIDPLRLQVEVAPAKVGPVSLDIRTTTAAGADAPVTFLVVELRLPKDDVGPLFVRMQRVSASHYRADEVELPLPGRWELSAEVFLARGAKARSTTSFSVH